MSRGAWQAVTATIAVVAVTTLSACGSGSGSAGAATPVGWATVWRDDFNGSGRLSGDWVYRTGTQVPGGPAQFGTGEAEANTDSTANVRQEGGELHVRAVRDAAGRWTSGRVETVRQDFRPPAHGVLAVEARLQLPDLSGPAALGYWPAFWMLGAPYRQNAWSWPGIGEIDIMESSQGRNTEWATLHCGSSPGGPCAETDGLSGQAPGGTPGLESAPHTYRVEWDESRSPAQLRWYLDGRLIHQVGQDQLPAAVWSAAMDHGYYLILDLAIGGQLPAKLGGGPTSRTRSGGELLVDYVTAQSRAGP
ncbi:MAG: hypothetical protein QOI76_3560 [Frankiales bacterium]|nr:hypothetical protein [Frankiales bacterium]